MTLASNICMAAKNHYLKKIYFIEKNILVKGDKFDTKSRQETINEQQDNKLHHMCIVGS